MSGERKTVHEILFDAEEDVRNTGNFARALYMMAERLPSDQVGAYQAVAVAAIDAAKAVQTMWQEAVDAAKH
jgi:hypothetical protein